MLLSLFNFPQWDSDLLVYVNSKRIDFLDPVMVTISTHWLWAFISIGVVGLMIWNGGKRGVYASVFLSLSVMLTSIVNNLLKLVIRRPRPCEDLDGIINILEDCGDAFSFFSAHSSNSFCLAIFSSLYFRNKYYSGMINIWALTVAYSRLYVGKHYPLDVIFGISFGIVMGFLCFQMFRKYEAKKLINA